MNSSTARLMRRTLIAPIRRRLVLGALTVLERVHRLGMVGQLIPGPLLEVGILAVATGLSMRGVAGIGWALGMAPARSKLFYKLNLMIYTPVCLVLFVAAVAAALS